MKRTFDIQEIDYKRSSKSKGRNHESKGEGIVPYTQLFGYMINDKRDTRPLGKEDGDLGKGWGSSSWMTGYLMVDLERFEKLGTEHLKKRNRVDFLIISKLDIALHFLLKLLQIWLQRKVL